MTYFRVMYQGYYEGEHDTEEKAIEKFKELSEDDDNGIMVEKFNEETNEWE